MKTSENFFLFRSECRKYTSYLKERDDLKQKVNLEQYKINGVHSVRFEKTYRQSSRIYHSILHDVEVKTLIQMKLDAVNHKIGWIEECIDAIPYPFHKVVAWRVYIMHESVNKVAEDYEIDREHLRKMSKHLLNLVLNDARMEEYRKIEKEYSDSKTIHLRLLNDHVELEEEKKEEEG